MVDPACKRSSYSEQSGHTSDTTSTQSPVILILPEAALSARSQNCCRVTVCCLSRSQREPCRETEGE